MDLGFPLYEIKDVGDLFAASLYRFAYGYRDEIQDEEFWKNLEFQGAYRIFLKRVGRPNIECRIIVFSMLARSVLAVEISKTDQEKWRVRSGPIAPAFDVQTVVLSDQPELTIVSQTVAEYYDPAIQPSDKVDLDSVYRIADDVVLLQAQDLQFYALRNSANSLDGTFLSKEDIGLLAGRRLLKITADDLLAVTAPVAEGNLRDLTDADNDLIQKIKRFAATASLAMQTTEGPVGSNGFEMNPELVAERN